MKGEFAPKRGTVVMAGMPKTGKSTFLGAFYHVLEAGRAPCFELEVLPDERRHLEGLRKRWLRVQREGRTSSTSPVRNELNLRNTRGERLVLRWPDLSGEYFDDMVRKRTLNEDVAEILQNATALVVFVHPDTIDQQPRIHEVNRVAAAFEAELAEETDTQVPVEGLEESQVEWDSMKVRGQVLVVELMQLLFDNHLPHSISGISLVLSAWDVVPSTVASPREYVRSQLPLLYQFLEANCDRWELRIFGVSAHGGDPETDKQTLQREIDPIDRIRVVCEDGTVAEDGILAPIRWLIE